MEFIRLAEQFEYRRSARHIIKSVLVNELGEPILRSDLLPKITDDAIRTPLVDSATGTEEVLTMPKIGEPMVENVLYVWETGLIKCRQDHNRTIYDPADIPNLFSFYRGELNEEGNPFEWIQNEEVKLGWKRIYEGVTYEVIQPHQTLITWEPTATIDVLWKKEATVGGDYEKWVRPTHAGNAYQTGEIVWYPEIDDTLWISKIDANVTFPDGDEPWNRYWEPYTG